MKIIIVKEFADGHGNTTFLKQIEAILTGPDTEFESRGFSTYENIGILNIVRVRNIPFPTYKTLEKGKSNAT